MKSKALSIVVLLLAVVLFGLLFVNHRQEQRQTAYMQQLQKEAMSYEQEINDIRLELAQKQRAINIKEDTSGILFGFVPASADDFTEIDKLAAEHSITPVILLDCSQEKEQLAQILEKAVAKDYEVVLAVLQFDESILQTADEMKDLLVQMDDTKSPAFLLRNNVNTEETRNLLNEHGYTELILYDASLQAGMQENGKPYICYGFFKQPVYYADYISQVVTAHTMMLASFSFSTIQNGTLQISDVERFMTLADDRKAANELRYVDLNSAFQAVADQNTTQQERQESYEKYEAEQEKRIQELEEKVSAIYSRFQPLLQEHPERTVCFLNPLVQSFQYLAERIGQQHHGRAAREKDVQKTRLEPQNSGHCAQQAHQHSDQPGHDLGHTARYHGGIRGQAVHPLAGVHRRH